jgi:hypothetical protein
MASFGAYPWYSGQAPLGVKTFAGPAWFSQYVQKQGGVRSWQPSITAPGTIVSAGTVVNSTGLDCNVYMAASEGITSVKILSSATTSATSYSPPGTIGIGQGADYMVPGPGAIAVTYAGSLAWTWVPV